MFRWKTMKTTILSRRAPESQKDPSETKGEASFQKGSRDQRNFDLYYLSRIVPEQLKQERKHCLKSSIELNNTPTFPYTNIEHRILLFLTITTKPFPSFYPGLQTFTLP